MEVVQEVLGGKSESVSAMGVQRDDDGGGWREKNMFRCRIGGRLIGRLGLKSLSRSSATKPPPVNKYRFAKKEGSHRGLPSHA